MLEIDPLVASAHYILGLIYQRQGDQDAALGSFKRTIYVDRDFVLAHFNLANLYKSRGDARRGVPRVPQHADARWRPAPEGPWTAFLGGFRPDLLAQTCERSLIECRRDQVAPKGVLEQGDNRGDTFTTRGVPAWRTRESSRSTTARPSSR